jgi:isocitrate dehydrogenase
LAEKLQAAQTKHLPLKMISNRGTKVWPKGMKETFCVDHWRARFKPKDSSDVCYSDIVELLDSLNKAGIEIIKTENLYHYVDHLGYTLAQGE